VPFSVELTEESRKGLRIISPESQVLLSGTVRAWRGRFSKGQTEKGHASATEGRESRKHKPSGKTHKKPMEKTQIHPETSLPRELVHRGGTGVKQKSKISVEPCYCKSKWGKMNRVSVAGANTRVSHIYPSDSEGVGDILAEKKSWLGDCRPNREGSHRLTVEQNSPVTPIQLSSLTLKGRGSAMGMVHKLLERSRIRREGGGVAWPRAHPADSKER